MGLLDGSAGLLFRIDADASGFEKEVRGVDDAIGGLNTKFGSFAGVASVATAGVVALASAAMTGATAILNLTNSVSDYGSALYDAQVKTGLSAATLGTLQLTADKAGSSFEQVSGSVSKFTVLLGQAQQGNVAANETLEKYGITLRDTEGALDQAITAIAAMETTELRAAAARELFKDKSLALLPVIEQLNGSLSEATKETIRTGKAMSEEGIRAADDYGDALVDLKATVAAAGRQFATELLPTITSAMQYISAAFVANQGVVSAWGKGFADVMRGTAIYAQSTASGVSLGLSAIGRAFGANAIAAGSWADKIVSEFGRVIASGGLLFYILGKIGAANPDQGEMGPPNMDKPAGMPDMPNLGAAPKGAARSGGGGGGSKTTPYQRAVKESSVLLEAYKAGNENILKENDRRLQLEEISAMDHARELGRIKLAEIQYEIDLTERLLKIRRISATEQEEATHKLGILQTQRYGQELQNAIDLRTQQEKDWDAEIESVAKDGAARRAQEQERAAARKALEEDLKRIKKLEAERWENFKKWRDGQRQEMDPYGVGKQIKKGGTEADGVNWKTTGGGDFLTGLVGGLGAANEQLPIMNQLGQSLAATFGQVAQAVGQAFRSFVLMGTAGTSFRKFAAEVIASIAQMSIVQAVFEGAQGLAMLALGWFTGNAKYFKSASDHFASAVAFGAIAGVAGGIGRGVAGNLFSSESGGGGGSGSGDGASAGNRPGLKFTETFNGFVTAQNAVLDKVTQRTNAVINSLTQTIQAFNDNYIGSTADVVVRRGASGASDALFDAHLETLKGDGSRATDLKRATGDFGYT